MMAVQTLCLSFGLVILTDEVFSKVTFDMQIRGKYTLSTKYCWSEVHVAQLRDEGVAVCDDLQWSAHENASPECRELITHDAVSCPTWTDSSNTLL